MSEHYPLVLVTWVDCTTFHGWHSLKASLAFEPDECQTAGFKLKETDKYVYLTATLAEDGEATLDLMVIPKSWVTKVEELALAASCKCEVGGEEKDCWGAPDREEEEEGIVIPAGQQVVLEIKGDDRLDRPLSLDEHIRRGGTYFTWPGLDVAEGPGRPAWLGKNLQYKEKE